MIAEALICLVVGITDGDTIKAKCDGQQVSIRLAGIDAPEKRQAFGENSRQNLASMCFQRQAKIIQSDTDRYGRIVAQVICDATDANLEQVRSGLAWMYRKYSSDDRLDRAERDAAINKRGIWSDSSPIPPWEWRRSERQRKNH